MVQTTTIEEDDFDIDWHDLGGEAGGALMGDRDNADGGFSDGDSESDDEVQWDDDIEAEDNGDEEFPDGNY